MHRAAQSREGVPTHIRFISPKWQIPFYHDMGSGEDVWVMPEGAVMREATAQEQSLLDAVELRIADAGWVQRTYGIMGGGYWYSARLGRVQRKGSIVLGCHFGVILGPSWGILRHLGASWGCVGWSLCPVCGSKSRSRK